MNGTVRQVASHGIIVHHPGRRQVLSAAANPAQAKLPMWCTSHHDALPACLSASTNVHRRQGVGLPLHHRSTTHYAGQCGHHRRALLRRTSRRHQARRFCTCGPPRWQACPLPPLHQCLGPHRYINHWALGLTSCQRTANSAGPAPASCRGQTYPTELADYSLPRAKQQQAM